MAHKFKVGDKVKFNISTNRDRIPRYFSEDEGIPEKELMHGSTLLGERYEKEFAKITYIHNEYYILSWINKRDEEMRLGFKEESFIFISRKGKAPKQPKINFLLKYDLENDPIEEFETILAVKKRIKELVATQQGLKRNSIVVYKVSKKMPIELVDNIIIKGIK